MAKPENITLEKAKATPAGGVLIGKKEGQTIIPADGTLGGFLIGRLHKESGIKAINKGTGQPIEMQGNEVVITSPAVADQTKREFQGKMMTNREILSQINEDGGGVSFAEGGDTAKYTLPSETKSYSYDNHPVNDFGMIYRMNQCGCEHKKDGGELSDVSPFLNYYHAHIADFFSSQNNITLEKDFTFRDRGEDFTIEPIVVSDMNLENPIKEAVFAIFDNEGEPVGIINFKENSDNKNFTAISELFGWNNVTFEQGGKLKKASEQDDYNDVIDLQDGVINNDSLESGGDVQKNKKNAFESEGSKEGKGKLYEFFTPQAVADKMLALAEHYGFHGGNVLEPACGNGRLIKHLKNCNITAFEISKENFAELQQEFPAAELYNFNFEKAFLKEPRFNTLVNKKGTESWLRNAPFDLVLANPPYGKFSGLYSGYFSFKGQVEHFFILQSLYLLKKGGLGVYLIPSSFLRNGIAYNDVKKKIFDEADFVDAYRMPANIFEKTQIGTDILILRKK